MQAAERHEALRRVSTHLRPFVTATFSARPWERRGCSATSRSTRPAPEPMGTQAFEGVAESCRGAGRAQGRRARTSAAAAAPAACGRSGPSCSRSIRCQSAGGEGSERAREKRGEQSQHLRTRQLRRLETCEHWASFQPYELPVDVPLCATYAKHPPQHMRVTGCMQLAASCRPRPRRRWREPWAWRQNTRPLGGPAVVVTQQ